jgi:hypothetical protein
LGKGKVVPLPTVHPDEMLVASFTESDSPWELIKTVVFRASPSPRIVGGEVDATVARGSCRRASC